MVDAAPSGRPHIAKWSVNNAEMERMLQEYRWVTIDELAEELKISYGSVRHVIQEVLQYSKVSASWLSNKLPPPPFSSYERASSGCW